MLKKSDGIVSLMVLCLLIYVFSHKPLAVYIGLTIGFISLLSESAGALFDSLYVWLIKLISKINSIIILTVIYIIFIVPVGLIIKIFAERQKTKNNSTFADTKITYTKEHLINPW